MRSHNIFTTLAGGLMLAAFTLVGCSDKQNLPASPGSSDQSNETLTRETRERLAELQTIARDPISYYAALNSGTDAPTVEVPAGSHNALAAAIASAGVNGTVILKSGLHTESATVLVAVDRITIIGEPGAVLKVDTHPLPPNPVLDPALYVRGADKVSIWNVEILPVASVGGVGILVDHADKVTIAGNTIRNHANSIGIQEGNSVNIYGNTMVGIPDDNGLIIVNGDKAFIADNDISNCSFGAWLCDRDGVYMRNTTHGNFIGMILCKVPENSVPMPDGTLVGAEQSATGWMAQNNTSNGNVWGYLIIDGANGNNLVNNAASGNSAYDVEFTGDTYRFGFLTPAAFNNKFSAGPHHDIIVKNCGNNNRINGGALVNNTTDPCY